MGIRFLNGNRFLNKRVLFCALEQEQPNHGTEPQNTAQGKNACLPLLPAIPGDEGVGEVVEINNHVSTLKHGDRVVFKCRMMGTWRYYGIYHEGQLRVITPKLALPEASMLTIAPCTAYRLIKDFVNVKPGQTVMQNAANSPVGQCVIQLCHHWGIKSCNIVANHFGYESVKNHLLSIGADSVYTAKEAQELGSFSTSMARPVLALNGLCGDCEDVMLRLLECKGTMVYYGCAYDSPMTKTARRVDAQFHKFHLCEWDANASSVVKDEMIKELIQLMVVENFKAPVFEPVELKDFVHAICNTAQCEALSTKSYIFDFTLP